MKAALICIAKRENRYIREWCEYHKRIGFDDIFIYDNNEGDERIRDVVGDLPYVRIDERYRNKRQVNVEIQLKCYNEWYAAHRGEYTHFAFFDVDEYLNISPEYKNLQDFIAHKFGIADGMKIFWKCHGDNGHLRYEDKPLHERFPEISEPKDSRYFYKMIFSTKREDFKMINVHYSTPLTHIVDVNGCRIKYSQTTYDRKAIYGKACIDHYITKSTEEFFMNKRGRKDDAKRLSVNFYYNFNDKTDTKDKLIKDILNGKAQQSPAMAAAVTAKPAQTAAAKPAQASEGTFKYHATDELLNKKNEKIIVSFTSWKKRINDCAHTVELMKGQTLKPDKIILNLSTDEFTNKEKDLPSNLLAMQDSVFEIYWVKENTKPHKKITHTLNRFPNDVIITIDDDIEYPKDFIEHLYSEYIAYDRQIPITSGTWQWDNKIYTHYGCFTLIKKEHVGEYYNDLYKNVVLKYGTDKIPFNDPLLTYAVLLNGRRYKMTPYFNMSAIRTQSIKNKQNPISKIGTTEYTKQMADEHKLIQDYIKRKYGKSYGDLFNAPVVVNITTWAKRDYCLYDMLSNLKKQTRKPDKIILWLSEEEYDKNNLPQTIQKCVNEKLLSDIMWVKKNTYCHKRFECFKYFNDCYNIFIDDDILYKPDFIKELIDGAKKHQDCVTVYSSNSIDYDGVKIIKKAHTKEPSHYNAFCGGICCFPPYILPNDVLTENIGLRDVYVKKCDESWLRPFLIRHDIKVNSLYDWNNSFYPTINNSQKDAVWVENFKTTNGIREKERNFFNAIKITHTEALCKKLWSKIGIDKWELTLPQAANNIKSQIIDKAHKKGFASFNIDEPKTWCEKMQWLQLNDNVELRAKCADKVLLHEYCKEKLGKDICVPILKIYSSPNGIKFNELPNKFVLKCNHGYAMNIICRDKSKLNENECKSKIQQWLNTPFGEKSIEPHYLKINRKCYAETFLENKGQLELTDYKFLCFNGTPKYVQIINGRHEDDFRLNYYDMNFNFVNISRCDIPNNPNRLDAKPSQFELMKEYATKLSADFRFVRVDFYEVDGVVYLGELTFTPATGFIKWTDPTIDRKFGDMIDLSYTPQNTTTPPPKAIPNHPTESGAPKTDCAQAPSDATRNTDTQSKPSNDGISICITAYQAQDFIEECLDSVARQTWFKDHDNWEVIVGIDGCEETLHKVESIMSNYKNLRVLMMNSNKGTYITSNTIMSQAKYAWLLRFDSDDIMNDDMVETLMNNRDKGDILLMQCQNFGLNENIRKGTQGVIMIRKNIFQKIGGYQPWRCSADGELLKRTSNIYTQYTIDKILFKRRIHPDSLTQKDGSTKLFNMDGSQNAGVERARRQQYIADLNIMYESDATITAMTNSFKEVKAKYNDGISICITAYQAQDFIEECLDSVARQTWFKDHNNWEVIVGIDGCPHTLLKIKEIMPKYKNLRVLMMDSNKGTYITSNTIIKEAKYNRVLRFDSDDIMNDDMISVAAEDGKTYDLTKFGFEYFGNKTEKKFGMSYGVALYNHDIFNRLGGFKGWRCGGDSDMSRRFTNENCKIYEDKRIVFKRRVHEMSLTQNEKTNFKSELRKEVLKAVKETDYTNPINRRIEYITNTFTEITPDSKIGTNISNLKNATNEKIENFLKAKAMNTRLKLAIDFENPQSVQDKISYLMVYDDNKMLKSKCADKILLHEYSKRILGEDICVPIIKVYDKPEDINFNELPDKYVLKCNHGYAMNIICKDNASNDFVTPKNIKLKTHEDCIKQLNEWLGINFGDKNYQWHYALIEPKCYAETFINDGNESLTDYKVWCCNGEPKMIMVISDRYTKSIHENIYDLNWNTFDIGWTCARQDFNNLDKKPEQLEKMLEYSKALSKDFRFVRVDFYIANNRIYLGELTFSPNGGIFGCRDKETELYWGDMININDLI